MLFLILYKILFVDDDDFIKQEKPKKKEKPKKEKLKKLFIIF